jgi:hypothetical protein
VFSIDKLAIRKTRSRGDDSDYVFMTVKVTGQEPITIFKFIGDLGTTADGAFHEVKLAFAPVHVPDPSARVGFYFLVYNLGNSTNPEDFQRGAVAMMQQLARDDELLARKADASGTPADTSESPWWKPIVEAIEKYVESVIHANCDGPVARKKYLWRASELPSASAASASWTLHPDVNHNPPVESDLLPFEVKSPTGCGANSDYSVAWSVQRVSR